MKWPQRLAHIRSLRPNFATILRPRPFRAPNQMPASRQRLTAADIASLRRLKRPSFAANCSSCSTELWLDPEQAARGQERTYNVTIRCGPLRCGPLDTHAASGNE